MTLFKTLKKALWEVLAEQEPFGTVNNQNIDYYLEKAINKAEKELKGENMKEAEIEEMSLLLVNCILLGWNATETAEYLIRNGYSKAKRGGN